MPRTAKIRGPRLRGAGSGLSDGLESYLVDGYPFSWCHPWCDWPRKKLRQVWLAHKAHMMRIAEKQEGTGFKPWAYFAFERGNAKLYWKQRENWDFQHRRPKGKI